MQDVVIVGGGSAGLQAALTLGRMRLAVTVLDTGRPSNAPAHAIGGLLGQHDRAPLDLLSLGRRQLAELPSVTLSDAEAARVDPGAVTTRDGTIAARAVVLATGADYVRPDIPGLEQLWGDTVIHCPFCHGWEARDQRIGLLAADADHAGHLLPLLARLSADVEVITDATALTSTDGRLRSVLTADGREVERDVLFVAAPPRLRDAAFAHLGLERNGPLLKVGDFGMTSVPGVFAAGDLAVPAPSVAQAIASGQRAAVGVVRELS